MSNHIAAFYKSKIDSIVMSMRSTLADKTIPLEDRIDIFLQNSHILPLMGSREVKRLGKSDPVFFKEVVLFLCNRSHDNMVFFVNHDHDLENNTVAWESILKHGYSGYIRV